MPALAPEPDPWGDPDTTFDPSRPRFEHVPLIARHTTGDGQHTLEVLRGDVSDVPEGKLLELTLTFDAQYQPDPVDETLDPEPVYGVLRNDFGDIAVCKRGMHVDGGRDVRTSVVIGQSEFIPTWEGNAALIDQYQALLDKLRRLDAQGWKLSVPGETDTPMVFVRDPRAPHL